MLHLIELGEFQQAYAKWLLERAGKTPGQLSAGGGRDTDRGVKKEWIPREVGPVAPLAYYTISILFVKVNLSIVVSMRCQSGGSAVLKPVLNSGSRDVQTFTSRCPLVRQVTEDSPGREEVGSRWDSAWLRAASVFFASSPPPHP